MPNLVTIGNQMVTKPGKPTMPTIKLTAAAIERLTTKKTREDYWDTLLPGFGLRVSQTGRKTWMIFPRVLIQGQWKKKWIKLDIYPALDLTAARSMARLALAVAAEGGDPMTVIKPTAIETKIESSLESFGAVRDDFLTKYRTRQMTEPRPRTLEEMRRVLSGKRFEKWETRPVSDISKRDVLDLLDNLVAAGKDVTANKTLVTLRMMLNWAESREIIKTVPTDRIKPPGAEKSRERVLTDDELKAVWSHTHATGGRDSHIHGDIVRVLLLTGQRRSEVAGMTWHELDMEGMLWEIPSERAKNKKPHTVPLTLPVVEILKRQQELQEKIGQSKLVFTTNGEKRFSGWSKSKERLDTRSGVTGWRLHDLRRTMVTGMNEMGIPPHIVEAVVNHVSGARGGVAGVYNRALYMDERRRALSAWARHVLAVVEGREVTGNVVRLDGAR